jgi:hypothetical protein
VPTSVLTARVRVILVSAVALSMWIMEPHLSDLRLWRSVRAVPTRTRGYGVRPMKASSLVCASASSGTSTRGPY